jgi:ribonuclease BN (tRNA processing enzyme)
MDASVGQIGAHGTASKRKQLSDYFELFDLDYSRSVSCGPFSIECRRTIHGVPTTAFRIQAGGRTLGFSADTAYDPDLISWLAAADLIVHEATNLVHTGAHTPYDKLIALPDGLRSRMRITHLPDDFDKDSSLIEPLYQGRCYLV